MQQNPTSKKDMIDFIRENLYPQPNDLNELTSLRQIKNLLERVIRERRDGIVHDEWADDDILGIAQEYLDELPEQRLANEEENIKFMKNVGLVSRKRKNIMPLELEGKIISYGIEKPHNPDSGFYIRTKGGKSRRHRNKSKKQ